MHASSISSKYELLRHLELVSCAAAETALADATASIADRDVLAARVILACLSLFATTCSFRRNWLNGVTDEAKRSGACVG